MAIYKLNSDSFHLLQEITFQSEKILERRDLQRLIRHQPEIISPDITTSDHRKVVVSNQWSKAKTDVFREAAGKMGFSISEIL